MNAALVGSVVRSVNRVLRAPTARPALALRPYLRPQPIQHPAFLPARAVATSKPLSDSSSAKVNIYSDFVVYKSKGAVAFKVIKPTWVRVSTGSGISVAREGTLLLEFANAISERNYDWEKKGTIALSALECAEVLEGLESRAEKTFYHDPSKGTSEEGQVSKSLNMKPAQQGATFYLNLSVTDKATGRAQYSTALSSAEARLVQSLMNFVIPRLLGFDEMFQGPPNVRDSGDVGGSPPF